jgi:hypothetical protein
MKMKMFVFWMLFGLFLVVNTSAQSVDKDKLPEYIVVTVKAKSLLSDFDVDIKIKKKQYTDELKKLEKRLDNNDLVESYNDLLIEMNDLGYEFLESFVRNESGSRHNLIFRKKK